MPSFISAIEDTVSISEFNHGFAEKIFSDVRKKGPKVVLRNNSAEAVIISPDEYVQIMEDLNDYLLLSSAVERMASFDPLALLSDEKVDQDLGITTEEIYQASEVEIE